MGDRIYKLLVVEDDEDLLNVMDWIFDDNDIEIVKAQSFERALEIIGSDRPDLIICDVELSGKSGIDICRKIKSDPVTQNIPFILMSAFITRWQLPKDIVNDGFVAKPFDVPRLHDMVRTILVS